MTETRRSCLLCCLRKVATGEGHCTFLEDWLSLPICQFGVVQAKSSIARLTLVVGGVVEVLG